MVDSLMASEQQGDIEYTWKFANQLDSNPLFKLGFNPSNIYYQRNFADRKSKYLTSGIYYGNYTVEDFKKKAEEAKPNTLSKALNTERYEATKTSEVPVDDFVWMAHYKAIDDKESLGTHIHEFVHRTFHQNKEFVDFYNKNRLGFDDRAHGLIAYMIGKQFPELKDSEYNRANKLYRFNIDEKETEQEFKKLYEEATKIAEETLVKRYNSMMAPILKKQKEKSKEKLSLIDRIKQLFTGG